MSRSMHYFRKYSGPLLAVFGVVLMVLWVVGPYFDSLIMPSPGTQRGDVVVTWTGGNVREADLDQMRMEHGVAVRFLFGVIEATQKNGGTPQAPGLQVDQQGQVIVPGIPVEDSDEALVQTMLLAEKGRRLGVRVNRETVKDFLDRLSAYTLKEGDWLDIAHQSLPEARDAMSAMSVGQLLDRLEIELLAQNMRIMEHASLFAIPPGQMWDYYLRLNRRAKIEAVPLEVERFVSQVSDPKSADEAELRAIFEKGKNREPNPALAEPGFRSPQRVAFGYFTVDFAPFLGEAKKKITEDQIKEEYEKAIGQGQYKVLDLPAEDPAKEPATDPADPAKTPEKEPAQDPEKDATKDGEKAPAKDAADDSAKKTDSDEKQKDADSKAAPAKEESDEKKSDTAPADDAKPADGDADEQKSDEKKNVRSTTEAANTVFVSVQDEEAADKKSVDKPEEMKPAEATSDEEQPSADKPADSAGKKAADKPADAPADKPADKPADEPAKPTDTPAEKTEEAPKFKPLEEVRDDIVQRLAQPIAEDARRETLKKLAESVNNFGRDYRRWLVRKEASPNTKQEEPQGFNPEALAKQFEGVTYHSTKLVDRYEIGQYDIGQKAFAFDFQRGGMLEFADMAFAPDAILYNPQQMPSREQDMVYLFWRTKEEAAKDVTFEDVRKEVVAAWKKQKAFEIAKQEAEQLAKKAQDAKSLKDVTDPSKVLEPPAFSWLTSGGLAFGMGEPSLSTVEGITYAGREFMEGVFSLEPNEAGIAPNQPHTQVYVVHVVNTEPKLEELRERFLDTGFNFETLTVARRETMRVSMELDEDLNQQFGIEWHRQPAPGNLLR